VGHSQQSHRLSHSPVHEVVRINRSGAAQLQIGIFVGYFLMAIPAGQIMRHFGYKSGWSPD